MTWQCADRVKETTTTTGTGAITLGGAMLGFRAFSSVCSVGDTCYYALQGVDANGNPTAVWEVGVGTYSAASTLTRTTVLASSNSNAAVTLAGTTQVWIDQPATALSGLVASLRIGMSAQNSTTQALAANTYVTITGWTSVTDNSNGAWNASTGVFTVAQAGWYLVTAQLQMASKAWASGDFSIVSALKNSTTMAIAQNRVPAAYTGYWSTDPLVAMVYCAVGDTLAIQVELGTSTAGTLSSFTANNNVAIIKM
jgi:hypothetical protein